MSSGTELYGLSLDVIASNIKKTQAEVLNVIEASYSDVNQRDAVKILVKRIFNRSLDAVRELAGVSEYSSPQTRSYHLNG